VRARAPLDVDLEDKLLYGLTPMRLAYLMVALLGGFALWSSPWAPSPARAVACLAVVGIGAAAAWGRWQGRPVDAWVSDVLLFTINTRRVELNRRWLQRLEGLLRRSPSTRPPTGPTAIVVAARAPNAKRQRVKPPWSRFRMRSQAEPCESWPRSSPSQGDS
jgi:hypothetical protein